MKARGYFELTTTELPDELQFRVTHHAGWEDWFRRIVPPAIIVSTFFVPSFHHIWVYRVLIFFAMADSRQLDWIRGRTTELRVTSSELVATGNLRKLFSRRATVPASEVMWLGFDSYGSNQPGFAVEGGEIGLCVLPGLNREQAEAIADTILRRFPNIRSDMPR
jgi:hypothetical protein